MYESNRPERTDREEDEREEYLKLTDQHRARRLRIVTLLSRAHVRKGFEEFRGDQWLSRLAQRWR